MHATIGCHIGRYWLLNPVVDDLDAQQKDNSLRVIKANSTKNLINAFSARIKESQTAISKTIKRNKPTPISSQIQTETSSQVKASVAEKKSSDVETSSLESLESPTTPFDSETHSFDSQPSVPKKDMPDEERAAALRVKNAAKIKNIVDELLETEIRYVERITMLDKLFREPFLLKADPSEKYYPSAKTIDDMFSNLVCIIGFHTNFFLPMIKERVESWTEDSEIGDIFTKLAPLFNLYTIYCQSYDNCVAIIDNTAKKFPKFATDLNHIEKKKECKDLRLTHHMLDLIQRIPRYNLMLNEILKHSEPQTAKYENIKNALNLMSAAAHKANDRLTESKNATKMFEIQSMFADSLNVVTAGRSFVKEGDLMRRSHKNSKFVACHLILFNDYLICCVKQSASKYRKKVEFEFSTIGLIKDPDDKTPTAFGISNLNELLILKSTTLEDKNSWIDQISNVISTHDDKISSFLIKNRGSSTESDTVSLHTVMVSAISIRPNHEAEWQQKQLTLTSENKIMITDQSKSDQNPVTICVDDCQISPNIFDNHPGIQLIVISSKESNQIISKYDDMFVERWVKMLKSCQTRTRSKSIKV